MKSSQQISLLQKTEDNPQNKIIFEKKLEFGKNAFIVWQKKYPDFRFSCPKCGTLDVLIESRYFDSLKGHCLECKTEWNEDGKQ